MKRTVLFLMLLGALVMLAVSPAQATCEATPACASLKPFSAETHFLSVPGYLRWLEFQQTGAWITRLEAVEQVQSNAVCGVPPVLSKPEAPGA